MVNGISVVSWDLATRIISLDIYGQPSQADVSAEIITQEQWTSFLSSLVQPIVDAMVAAKIYDPSTLIQQGDISSLVLTPEEIASIAKVKLGQV